MKKLIIFCMLLSYCLARSIDTGAERGAEKGAEVLDTPKEAVLEKSDILTDEIVEENVSQIAPQSDIIAGKDTINTNTRALGTFPTLIPKGGAAAVTVASAQRPFTQMLDVLLVVNSSSMTARK